MADERRSQRPERNSDGDPRSSSNRGTSASRGAGGAGRGASGSKPPARGDKPAYGKRDDKPGYRGSRDDRPAAGGRDSRPSSRGDKPAYGKRDDKPAYGKRDDKPAYGKRDDKPGYRGGSRDDKPAYGKRDDKPGYRGGSRDDKPAYGKRDDNGGYRGSRDDRPAAGGRDSRPSSRGDKPSYGNRDDKPAYGKRDDKPGYRGGSRDDKPSYGKRDDKPTYRAGDGRTAGSRPTGGRSGDRDKRPYSRERKDDARGEARPRRSMTEAERTAEQERYDGPPLPEEITGKELDRNVIAQLKGLPEKLAARVARHLAAAGMLIDSDPETAYKHTQAARARATRLAVVREATGEAAYAAGHYAEALSELRAAKRMNGAPDYLPIMADCHRALGQPEQAIKLAKSPSVANFSAEAKAEMTIVEAGARRDMGQLDAALRTLELAPLMSKNREGWVVRLRYAYADILEVAGRDEEALMWFHRTHAVDSDEMTDAAERAELLERKTR